MRRSGLVALVAVVGIVAAFVLGRATVPSSPAATPAPSASEPVAVVSPSPSATSLPTPTPTAPPKPDAPPPTAPPKPDAPPATAGWTRIGELAGTSAAKDAGVASSFTGRIGATDNFLLATLRCAGAGSLRIEAGTDNEVVTCEEAATEPWRMLAFIGEERTFTTRVTATGTMSWRLRVSRAPAPVAIPAITIGGDAVMRSGCGVTIRTSWGYEASDSCATTIPLVLDAVNEARLNIDSTYAAEGAVQITLPAGWTVTNATARCGRLDTTEASLPHFKASARCDVAASARGDRTVRLSGIPDTATRWLIELGLSARNAAGDEFSGPFYAWVRP